MTTNQEGVHATVRALTGTSRSYNEDWHALFDADGIAVGNFDSRMLAWINATLSTSYTNLNEAMQAFAVNQGFSSWSSINSFSVGGGGPAATALSWSTDAMTWASDEITWGT